MDPNAGKTVAEILKSKKASLKYVALPKGSPSWNDIMDLTWEEITRRARSRDLGFKTFKKLLSDPEYEK